MDLSSFLFINLTAAVSWMVVFCNTDCHLEREGKCAHDVTQAQMLADEVCLSFIHITFHHICQFLSSLSDSTQEVMVTSDETHHYLEETCGFLWL